MYIVPLLPCWWGFMDILEECRGEGGQGEGGGDGGLAPFTRTGS